MASCCLGFRMRVLNRVVSGIYDAALRPHGVRVSQVNILVAIAYSGPVRGVDLCHTMMMDQSTMSRDLERLIARKWINTTPGVGRANLLEITDLGRALIEKIGPDWEKAQAQVHEICGPALAANILEAVVRLDKLESQKCRLS